MNITKEFKKLQTLFLDEYFDKFQDVKNARKRILKLEEELSNAYFSYKLAKDNLHSFSMEVDQAQILDICMACKATTDIATLEHEN